MELVASILFSIYGGIFLVLLYGLPVLFTALAAIMIYRRWRTRGRL